MSSPEEDADIAACTPDFTAKAAAAGLGITGVLLGLLCAQTASFVRFTAVTTPIVAAMGLSGALSLFAATRIARLYASGAWLGAAVGAFASLAGTVWLIYSVLGGLFSLFALATPPVAILSTVVAALVIPRAQRADAARERLRATGLDLGL